MVEKGEQSALFDLEAGESAKREALDRFEGYAFNWIHKARRVAREICARQGTVTSDDVLEEIGPPEGLHHNVIGAIFTKGFVRVGFRRTRRPQGHARMIGVWRPQGKE